MKSFQASLDGFLPSHRSVSQMVQTWRCLWSELQHFASAGDTLETQDPPELSGATAPVSWRLSPSSSTRSALQEAELASACALSHHCDKGTWPCCGWPCLTEDATVERLVHRPQRHLSRLWLPCHLDCTVLLEGLHHKCLSLKSVP